VAGRLFQRDGHIRSVLDKHAITTEEAIRKRAVRRAAEYGGTRNALEHTLRGSHSCCEQRQP
jgi:hypothetical protein